jgi:pantetheine-phosphate adenylyltransferase
MPTALYPGSFDPIHYGHMDIVQRAASLFDELIVGIYDRPDKGLMFSCEERVALARAVLQPHQNVQISAYSGLTVDFARSQGVRVLVRGLRVISDFEYEYQMALTNQQLCEDIETICLMTRHEYAFLSASIVKEVFLAGGDVSVMVHPTVAAALTEKRDDQRDGAD